MLASVAHAACPSPLKAQSGWFAEVYDKRAPFDDKQGLISPPPSNSMNVALPISFAQHDARVPANFPTGATLGSDLQTLRLGP